MLVDLGCEEAILIGCNSAIAVIPANLLEMQWHVFRNTLMRLYPLKPYESTAMNMHSHKNMLADFSPLLNGPARLAMKYIACRTQTTLRHLLHFMVCVFLGIAGSAFADGIYMTNMNTKLTPATVAQLTSVSRAPGAQVNDIVEFVLSAQVANAAGGPGVYFTTYLAPGVEVLGAWFVTDASGATIRAPGSGGHANDGWGTRGSKAPFGSPFASVLNGRQNAVYGDTGIFYSTDARTSLFTADGSNIAKGPLGNPQGTSTISNGYNVTNTFNLKVGAFNLWDADQVNAFGGGGALNSVPVNTPPTSSATVINSVGQGAAPFGAGSAVAGPDTGYTLDNTGNVGPWKRIQYAGSQKANIASGPATADGTLDTPNVLDASGVGIGLGDSSPLPSNTNAVRWSDGLRLLNETTFVKVRVRLTPTALASGDGVLMNFEANGSDNWGSGSKDNPWRYFGPTVAQSATLHVLKDIVSVNGAAYSSGVIPTGATLTYRVRYVNLGNLPVSLVSVVDTVPAGVATAGCSPASPSLLNATSGVTFVSVSAGTTACPSGGATLNFGNLPNIVGGRLGALRGGQFTYDVKLSSTLANGTVVSSNSSFTGSDAVSTAAVNQVSTASVTIGVPQFIDVITALNTAVVPVNATTFDIPYVVEVKNTGTVNATNVQANNYLPNTFNSGSPVISIQAAPTIAAGPCTANGSFNGNANTALLAGTNTLTPGQSCRIHFTARATYQNVAAVPAAAQNNSTHASTASAANTGHTFPSGVATPPPGALATDQSTNGTTFPATANGDTPSPTPALLAAIGLTGKVFNDVNGSKLSDAGDAAASTLPTGLNAILINVASGNVTAVTAVANSGASAGDFSFANVANGSYAVLLSTANPSVGTAAPATSVLPTGWMSTGENNSGVVDAAVDGRSANVTVSGTSVSGINFGIQQRPLGQNNSNATQANPGGTIQTPVAATSFTTGASDPDGGSVVSYQVSFPSNADNVTINGTSYTAANFAAAFPIGYVVVPVANIGNITVDPSGVDTGAVTSVFVFRTVDNAGAASSNSYNATVPFGGGLNVSGSVYNDINGGSIDGVGSNAGGLTAYVVNGSGNTVGKATVAANGGYSIGGVAPGSYNVRISTDGTGVVGAAAPATALPANYVHTGEGVGATPTTADSTIDGITAISVIASDVNNINFGIQQRPIGQNNTNAVQTNPGGSIQAPVAATSFTSGASDPDGGSVVSFQLGFPSNADNATINGTSYTPTSFAAAFPIGHVVVPLANIGSITVDPAGAGTGVIASVFVFRTVDNAGAASSNSYTATVPFGGGYNVSGTVYNDINGGSVDGVGTNAGGLTAYVVNGTGSTVGKATVASNGVYSIGGIVAGSYSVRISADGAGSIGSVAPVVALPVNYIHTGEGIGAAPTTVDGASDGMNAITVVASDVSNVNFGIQQRPIGQSNTNAVQTNPGGTIQAPVAATSFTTGASDPDGGSVVGYQVGFPSNADNATINGTSYTPASFAVAFPLGYALVPTASIGSITVDPAGSGTGAITSVFAFRTVDNAGATSASSYNATVPFSGSSDMSVALGANTPSVIHPGQSLTALTLTCTNASNTATTPTCVPTVNAGVISNIVCSPTSPPSLAAGSGITCLYDYLAPGSIGGVDEPTTSVIFTGTTGAANDGNAANNVATITAIMIDAVDDSTGAPGGSTGQTTNVATNDQFPVNSVFSLQAGSTCANAAVSTLGVASYDVPANSGCRVNYRVCAPAPNSTVCDTATLTIAATASDLSPVLSVLPAASSPGASIAGTVTCTNTGPATASNAVCNVVAVDSTSTIVPVNMGTCNASSGTAASLPVSATLVCPFNYNTPGVPGGTDTVPVSVTLTGVAGAANDSNGGLSRGGNNSTAAIVVAIIDARDDTVNVPFGVAGTLSLVANDTNGAAVASTGTNGNVTLTVTSPLPPDVTIDTGTGIVSIASRALPGSYVFTYQICARPAVVPAACDTALVTINVLAKIDVVKAAGIPKQTGAKTFEVPYVVVVGMVSGAGAKVFNVQANDNLRSTFAAATSVGIKAGTLSVKAVNGTCNGNAAFDGVRDTRLLAGIDALGSGQNCLIAFTALVDFGGNAIPLTPQNNRVYASGVSRPEVANPGYSFSGDIAIPPDVASTIDESTTGAAPAANSAPGTPPVTPSLPNVSDADVPAPTPVLFTRQQLGVAKRVIRIAQNSLRSYTVTFEVVVANVGNINATNVQVTERLNNAFPPPATINTVTDLQNSSQGGGATIPQCAANPGFGLASPNLMTGQTDLAAGQSCNYRFIVNFTASGATGPFRVSAVATSNETPAATPGGIPRGALFAEDFSDSGSSPNGTNPGAPGDSGGDNDPTPVELPASISGAVWNDATTAGPGNRVRDPHEAGLPGYTAEVIYPPNTIIGGTNLGGQIVPTTLGTPAVAVSDANGDFSLLGIPAGNYQLRFRAPTTGSGPGPVAGIPINGENNNPQSNSVVNRTTGTLDITVQPGVNLSQQGIPIDPSGVVYHSITREPIGAVRLEMFNSNGVRLPSACLLPDQQGQTTISTGGNPGFYRFDLIPGADPACPVAVTTYTIRITPPAGYTAPSALLPPAPPLASQSATYPVVPLPTAPQVGQSTVYHLAFNLGASSADVIHNHIPLDAAIAAQLFIQKLADKRQAELGDSVLYQIKVKNPNAFAIPAVKVIDKLPLGFKLIADTSTLQIGTGPAIALKDSAINGFPGSVLTYTVGTLAANSDVTIAYRVRLGIGADRGDATNIAYAQSGVIRSLNAQAKLQVAAGVFTTDACIIGKVYIDCNSDQLQSNGELGIPGVRLYLESGTNVTTDENGQYSICGVRPITHVLRLDETTVPVGARFGATSNRNMGSATSLFVDLKYGELHRADFREESCTPQVLAQVHARLRSEPVAFGRTVASAGAADTNKSSDSGVKADTQTLPTSTKTVPSLPVQGGITMTDGMRFRRIDGVALTTGEGSAPVTADETHWRNSAPLPKGSKIRLSASANSISADGRSIVQVHIELLGANGELLPAGTPVAVQLESNLGRLLVPAAANVATGAPTYTEHSGISVLLTKSQSSIALQAPTTPGTARLRISGGDIASNLDIDFVPEKRPMIVVGIAEGGINFKKQGKTQADAPEISNILFEDPLRNWTRTSDDRTIAGRVALFAKGVVGEGFLLTAAVDSDKLTREKLFRDIDPNVFYPIYGDASIKQFDAQSSSRAYLRIDKDKSFLIYGDYNTSGEGSKLSNYSRSLTGVKLHVDAPPFRFTTFAAQSTNRSYVDEQPGRGISGPYSIGRPNAIVNSEQVELLVRDRNTPAIVLTRRLLTRFIDYDFEPFSGRLLFRQPIASVDENSNPVSIRVSYEVDEGGDKNWVAGFDTRLSLGKNIVVGANYAKDNNGLAPYSVGGVNTEIKLGQRTTLFAEMAQTNGSQYVNRSIQSVLGGALTPTTDQSGKAARIELRHSGEDVIARAYVAKSDAAFQNPSAGLSPGREEAGFRVDYKVNDTVTLNGEWLNTADNSGTRTDGAKRAAGTLGVGINFSERFRLDATINSVKEQQVGGNGGYLSAIDAQQASLRGLGWNSTTSFGFNGTGLLANSSTYAGLTPNAGASVLVPNDYTSLKLRLNAKVADNASLYGEYEHAADERQRTAVGGDVRFNALSRLYVRHEFADSLSGSHGLTTSGSKGSNTVIGVDAEYMKDVQVFSEYRLAGGQNGQDVAAAIGLRNLWRVGEGISVSTAIEQQAVRPSSASSQKATAVSVGAEYTASALYKMGGKLEYRTTDVQDAWLSTLAYDRKLTDNWTGLVRNLYMRQQASGTATENGAQTQDRLQVGLAYRDTQESLWHALGRVERRADQSTAVRAPLNSDILIASLHGNYHPSRSWTFAGEFAHKNVNERFATGASGNTNIVTLGNASKWTGNLFGGRVLWDVAERLDASLYASTQSAKAARLNGLGGELGYRVIDNLWLSGGFTRGKFSDVETFGSNQNWHGWHLRLRFKFDENSAVRQVGAVLPSLR